MFRHLLLFVFILSVYCLFVFSVAIVRVDTFSVSRYSVDIHLTVALSDYNAIADRFQAALARVLAPWTPRIYKVIGEIVNRRKLLQTSVNTK